MDDNKKRILLLDDEEAIILGLSYFIRKMGYEVGIARSGEETIEIYRESVNSGSPFDLLLLDLTIPGGMGGKEALHRIHSEFGQIKAIVSSGYSNDPVISNFKEEGFIGCLIKPYEYADLEEALAKAFAK